MDTALAPRRPLRRSFLSREKVKEIQDLTLKIAGEVLPSGVVPLVRWNYSRESLGLAFTSFLCFRDPRITYSRRLMKYASEAEQIETVYHEISHLIVFYDLSANHDTSGVWEAMRAEGDHGPLFRAAMAKFGYPNPTGCGR